MGCDIHWYSETKRDGKWVCDQADTFEITKEDDEHEHRSMNDFPNGDRNYWLFGLLNNEVRTSWPWSWTYRDKIPDDASPEVKKIYEGWGQDAHSASYRTRAEFKEKIEELKPAMVEALIDGFPDIRTEHVSELIERLQEIVDNLNSDVPDSDQRLIFWFDN